MAFSHQFSWAALAALFSCPRFVGCWILLLFSSLPARSQVVPPLRIQPGTPFITSYTVRDYNDQHAQNWAIVEDNRGVMYVGNGNGVLEFDGTRWRIIQTRNKSLVRSLAKDSSGRVFVGALDDLGYLAPDNAGTMKFISLLEFIDPLDRDFGDVAKVHAVKDGVYFQTFGAIFRWSNHAMKVIVPRTRFHLSFAVGEKIYVREDGVGLMEVLGDSLRLLPDGGRFADKRIYSMLPYDADRVLITTRSDGMFLYDRVTAVPFPTTVDAFLSESQVYHGTVLSDGSFAFATIRNGVVVIDSQGRLLKIFNKNSGLQDENVWYVAPDDGDGLWLALNNGIARVEYPSPLSVFDAASGLEGAVTSIVRQEGRLFVATAHGVFVLDESAATPAQRVAFREIPGTATQCWDLLPFRRSLLIASDRGVFELVDGKLTQLTERYSFSLARSAVDSNRVYVGLQSGLSSLILRNGRLHDAGRVEGVEVEVRSMVETRSGWLWLSTRFQGVLRIDNTKGFSRTPTVEQYLTGSGLPPLVASVRSLHGRIVFDTERGIMTFDERSRTFIPDRDFAEGPADVTGTMYRPVEYGRDTSLVDAENGFFIAVHRPDSSVGFLLESPLNRIELNVELALYREKNGILWLGGSDGLVSYDPRIRRGFAKAHFALVRRASTIDGDSVLYGGNAVESQTPYNDREEVPPIVLPYEANALRIECAATSYDATFENTFQYFLEGFDKNWSEATSEPKKDYTNLPEGLYTFRVRSQNVYGQLSVEDAFRFRILPPWYRTWWAYGLYTASIGLLLFGFIKWRLIELERKNKLLEQKIDLRTAQLKKKTEDLAHTNIDLEREKQKSENLLHNILPVEVADELRERGSTTPRRYESATIMFTDFKGFTDIVSRLPVTELVNELNDLYRHFDDVIGLFKLEKIKTVGDSYMIAGGLPQPTDDHALGCVGAAREMLRYLEERNAKNGHQWQMRVGVHTGPVLAGVVGKFKFTYDVWGDTVNIASRLESSGEAGRINVSSQTYELIKDTYACEYRGKVVAKGKGKIDMYFVSLGNHEETKENKEVG